MKLGKQEGSWFDDRIDVEVSPSQLEKLIDLAKEVAMGEKDYGYVSIRRELKDLLQKRFDEYNLKRNEKDGT